MFKSISRVLSLALSLAAGGMFASGVLAEPVVYAVAADVHSATSHRLELTLIDWRAQGESQSVAVRSDMRADGHGYIFAALPKPAGDAVDSTT